MAISVTLTAITVNYATYIGAWQEWQFPGYCWNWD